MRKKLLTIVFFIILLVPTLAFADPFLVCDPVPKETVTHYVVTIGGNTEIVPAFDLGDGTVRLQYDLAGISTGNHNVEVKAKNIWGESVAVPFDFVKALPDVPGAIRIE